MSKEDIILDEIQNRVLWLSMNMIHHVNASYGKSGDPKVGGHQASSSSIVTIMTSLYFDYMRAGDLISVKPHASPVFHAIQYILGNLDKKYLTTLRRFHGLQAYPSRTKDPDKVDFSTGSVGLGAVAPNFAALTREYINSHINSNTRRDVRHISVLGDAELDEGSVWEAISEPAMLDLSNVLWVVDLNRQSLDRIIPGIRVKVWQEMMKANGWNVIEAKYGKGLQKMFTEPHGELLRDSIDGMSNEMYQRLLRISSKDLREWLPRTSKYPEDLKSLINQWDDEHLESLFHNLGGHDFSSLRDAFGQVTNDSGPNVVFAYTMKGWMLPSIGDPQNHNVVLSNDQMEELRSNLGIAEKDAWAKVPSKSLAGKLCNKISKQMDMNQQIIGVPARLEIPKDFGRKYAGNMSTQQIFGLVMTDIARNTPEVSKRVVTLSPDVASSTNLGGWINKVGVWSRTEKELLPDEGVIRALKWEESIQGQHIELGISENNFFLVLGQLGLSLEMNGELLFPIGTLYDPFIRRGLDAFVYSVYSGGKFLVIGTPSGVTLAPEGGAHQSMVTPSLGVEIPELAFYEPCFGQELEWILLDALENIQNRTQSTYLRLTSQRVDQGIFKVPADLKSREILRRQVLNGAYLLEDRRRELNYQSGINVVNIMASGAMIPEAVKASRKLISEGVMANVISITGPGPLYHGFQELVRSKVSGSSDMSEFMKDVIPCDDRKAPIVTVIDGHPHSLAWLGSALNTITLPLGVDRFGQSGNREDLYREYEIDDSNIMEACFSALET